MQWGYCEWQKIWLSPFSQCKIILSCIDLNSDSVRKENLFFFPASFDISVIASHNFTSDMFLPLVRRCFWFTWGGSYQCQKGNRRETMKSVVLALNEKNLRNKREFNVDYILVLFHIGPFMNVLLYNVLHIQNANVTTLNVCTWLFRSFCQIHWSTQSLVIYPEVETKVWLL